MVARRNRKNQVTTFGPQVCRIASVKTCSKEHVRFSVLNAWNGKKSDPPKRACKSVTVESKRRKIDGSFFNCTPAPIHCRRLLFVVERTLHCILNLGAIHSLYAHIRIDKARSAQESHKTTQTPRQSTRTDRYNVLIATAFCHDSLSDFQI